jgi:uncharacterized DUF497 family protein
MVVGDFEWDDAKAAANLAKHGVSFIVAIRAFADPQAVFLEDDRLDYGEERWNLIGMVSGIGMLVTVCHVESDRIRIISARKSSPAEHQRYLSGG